MESVAFCVFSVCRQMVKRSQKTKYERRALILPFQRTWLGISKLWLWQGYSSTAHRIHHENSTHTRYLKLRKQKSHKLKNHRSCENHTKSTWSLEVTNTGALIYSDFWTQVSWIIFSESKWKMRYLFSVLVLPVILRKNAKRATQMKKLWSFVLLLIK